MDRSLHMRADGTFDSIRKPHTRQENLRGKVQTTQGLRLLAGWCAASSLFLGAALPKPVSAGSYSMTLLWTAPGDDGDAGRAAGYDLRYSTSAVGADTSGWWGSAIAAISLPMPSISGQSDSAVVSGLVPETTYHFVLRTIDDAGNVSGFSNVLTATTDSEIPPPAPGCDVPALMPAQFSAVEDSGAVALSWSPTSDPVAGALHLWRAAGASGAVTLLATVSDPAQTLYRDPSVRAGSMYRYRATWAAGCGDGPATPSRVVSIPDPPGSPGEPAASSAVAAVHAYPNPSTDVVHFLIHVENPSGGHVQIRLFDLSGRVIAEIADGSFPSGETVISWPRLTRNGDRVAPGYYESLGTIGNTSVRERLILLP